MTTEDSTNSPVSATVLDEALALAEGGLAVFPCKKTDKRPATDNGFKDATRDPALIEAMFAGKPHVLVGVPTGAINGIDVLDVDPRHGGDRWIDDNRDRLPKTRIHMTRSGGQHLLFEHTVAVKSSAGVVADGIDIRGNGGYVIWWPAHGFAVDNFEDLARWPDWLIDILLPPPPPRRATYSAPALPGTGRASAYAEAALKSACSRIYLQNNGSNPGAVMNREAFSLGRFVMSGDLPQSVIENALADAARGGELSDREIARVINKALSAGMRS